MEEVKQQKSGSDKAGMKGNYGAEAGAAAETNRSAEADAALKAGNGAKAGTAVEANHGTESGEYQAADEETFQEDEDDAEDPVDAKKEVISWILYFVAAIAIALFLKNYIIINANIPTGSMENTIMTGDNVIGFRLSYVFSEPKRGDIIIFKYPDDRTQNFVKRVIGLPGETVTIRDAKVYINGSEEPLDESYLKEEWVRDNGPFEFIVPEGCYFVMGDNRNSSKDSRYWINTYVPEDDIIGKAILVYFPFNHAGMLE